MENGWRGSARPRQSARPDPGRHSTLGRPPPSPPRLASPANPLTTGQSALLRHLVLVVLRPLTSDQRAVRHRCQHPLPAPAANPRCQPPPGGPCRDTTPSPTTHRPPLWCCCQPATHLDKSRQHLHAVSQPMAYTWPTLCGSIANPLAPTGASHRQALRPASEAALHGKLPRGQPAIHCSGQGTVLAKAPGQGTWPGHRARASCTALATTGAKAVHVHRACAPCTGGMAAENQPTLFAFRSWTHFRTTLTAMEFLPSREPSAQLPSLSRPTPAGRLNMHASLPMPHDTLY